MNYRILFLVLILDFIISWCIPRKDFVLQFVVWVPPPARVSWSLCPLVEEGPPPRSGAHDSVVESAISQQKAQAHCLQQRGVCGAQGRNKGKVAAGFLVLIDGAGQDKTKK